MQYAVEKTLHGSLNLTKFMSRIRRSLKDTTRLVASVAEAVTLCAAPIWDSIALDKQPCRETAQRVVRVARVYRTVSTKTIVALAIAWGFMAKEKIETKIRPRVSKDKENQSTKTAKIMVTRKLGKAPYPGFAGQ